MNAINAKRSTDDGAVVVKRGGFGVTYVLGGALIPTIIFLVSFSSSLGENKNEIKTLKATQNIIIEDGKKTAFVNQRDVQEIKCGLSELTAKTDMIYEIIQNRRK